MLLSCFLLLWCAPDTDGDRFGDHVAHDALEYDIQLDLDPVGQEAHGSVGYRFRATEPLSSVRLDASRSADWKVEFLGPEDRPLGALWDEAGVTVDLGREVAIGEEFRFQARLRGRPPDGLYFSETRRGQPIAFTDHYSIRARGWLPCEDNPADRARFRLALSYPAGFEAIASGQMAPVESVGDRRLLRTQTHSDLPPYLFALVVGPFVRVPEAGDDRIVDHLVYSGDVSKASKALVHHAQWMRAMERAFGAYAYTKYAVIQCPTRWGGFEAPGNVLISESLFDRGRAKGVLAHELVHMWFGDAVGYARWREVWLSEGFASYFGPWLQAMTGGPSLLESLKGMRDRWRLSRVSFEKSVRWDGFPNPDEALNANTYPKGAWILHMLRGELGDEVFFRALSAYYQRFSGSSVITADLVKVVEEVSGRELGWFFEQWLDRPGCPILRLSEAEGSPVIEQVHEGAPYRFRLRLRWPGDDGVVHDKVLEITEASTPIPVPAGQIKNLELDPEVELLFKLAEPENSDRDTIKVFVLAGQSNMQGQGVVEMDHPQHYNHGKGNLVNSIKNAADPELYAHVRDKDGHWIERDDVWVRFLIKSGLHKGPLTVGYTGYGNKTHIGPEFQFGHVVGERFEEPVLLIKTAWGGKSLYKDFRPPSAGGEVGAYYNKMMDEVEEGLRRIGHDFPELEGKKPEIAGFVWFQGWNDMFDEDGLAHYEGNLVHLIHDVREAWSKPNLPVVIGELGNMGDDASKKIFTLRAAQAAAAARAEFEGTVKFVRTAPFARAREESPNVGHGHHWFGNAESYFLIGGALGQAMIELVPDD